MDTEEPEADAEKANAEEEGSHEEEEEEQSFQTAKSGSKSTEEQLAELDETACQDCGSTDRGEEMLLCDGCDHGYHMDCLDPPVAKIPDGDWFCPVCAEANEPVAATAAAAAKAGPSSQLRRPASGAQQEEEGGTDSEIVQSARKRGRRSLAVLDSSDDEDCIADAAVTVHAPAIHVKAEPGCALISHYQHESPPNLLLHLQILEGGSVQVPCSQLWLSVLLSSPQILLMQVPCLSAAVLRRPPRPAAVLWSRGALQPHPCGGMRPAVGALPQWPWLRMRAMAEAAAAATMAATGAAAPHQAGPRRRVPRASAVRPLLSW